MFFVGDTDNKQGFTTVNVVEGWDIQASQTHHYWPLGPQWCFGGWAILHTVGCLQNPWSLPTVRCK